MKDTLIQDLMQTSKEIEVETEICTPQAQQSAILSNLEQQTLIKANLMARNIVNTSQYSQQRRDSLTRKQLQMAVFNDAIIQHQDQKKHSYIGSLDRINLNKTQNLNRTQKNFKRYLDGPSNATKSRNWNFSIGKTADNDFDRAKIKSRCIHTSLNTRYFQRKNM